MTAFYQGDAERADAAVRDLLATTRQLGMERLPDLSLGAATSAVRAAEEGDFVRAGWALEAAELLDPGRPETAFAGGTVARLQGDYTRAVLSHLGGYGRLFGVPLQRVVWLHDVVLWGLVVLLLAGAWLVALEMATHGGALIRDLAAFLHRFLPRPLASFLAGALLVWPAALPYGLLWLALYWSVLLWGYGSWSERTLFAGLWILLGGAPLLVAVERQAMAVALTPPVRAIESLAAGRLDGSLFTDLAILESALPESPAVKQLLGDLHRRLGQWDIARSFYRETLEMEPESLGSLIDLGTYYFRKGDFGSAIQFFQTAATAHPQSAAAYFNLSQAYSESYLFDESRETLRQARQLDEERVSRWLQGLADERVVTLDGGVARVGEIRSQLLAAWGGDSSFSWGAELWRRGASLLAAAGTLLVALGLHLVRRRKGYGFLPGGDGPGPGPDLWRRILLPGIDSVESGRGLRALVAALPPAALVTLPFVGAFAYPIPWGYDPGALLPWIAAGTGAAVYLALRIRRQLAEAA